MAETFANSITGLIFDGQTLRIEFGVTRFDEVKPNTQITGRRYPACRLVLPPAAAVDLINRMQQIAKRSPRPASSKRRRGRRPSRRSWLTPSKFQLFLRRLAAAFKIGDEIPVGRAPARLHPRCAAAPMDAR